uniref:8.9 kDa family member n=1 Tax=Rhipicephalus zambeziensis TaxID=60191 RepID=A0A224Y782_9ACAR
MILKERQWRLLGLTFITAQCVIYIAHCQYAKVPCNVTDGYCYKNATERIKNGYDYLYPPPNCSKWVCNVSQEAFLLYGCESAAEDPYQWLPMLQTDCFYPKCCKENCTQRPSG